MGEGLAGLGAAKEDGVGSLRGAEGELVEADALAAGGGDAGAGSGGEGEGADGHLGDLHEADVVGDLADDDGGLAVLSGHVFDEAGQGDGGAVDLGHVQALEDGGAEGTVGPAGEERVELDQEAGVGVLGLDDLGAGLVSDTASSGFKIDSHVELVVCGLVGVVLWGGGGWGEGRGG